MNLRRMLVALFWTVMVAAPIAISLIAIAQFPPNTIIPLHWGIQGEIDNWGSPWGMLTPGLIMASANLLLALMYRFSDWLYDHGLVHGISRKATRPSLCGAAIFMVALSAGVSAYWVFRTLTSM